ncbi:MAG: DNA pilot protein [Microviridae sp.]|nr:MAG: DNA pilot protein [Microviridae sp.]
MGAITPLDIAAQGLDIVGNQITAKQQFERQKKLMGIQQQNQMALNEQGQQIQLDTWKQTNYPAQVEMLKSAGLNPGLLYSKGGTGGTTGSQSGGSAASGTAQQAQPMNIANIIQMKAMEAGIKAQEASARKANAEARVIEEYGGGQAGAGITATEAQAGKSQAEAKLAEVNARIAEIEEANTQSQIDAKVSNTIALTNKLVTDNAISTGQAQSLIKKASEEAIGASLDNELTRSKINLTDTEKQGIITGIVQKWTELSQKGQQISIEKFNAEIKAEYPSMGDVAGSIAKKAYKTLQNIENYLKGETQPIKDKVK